VEKNLPPKTELLETFRRLSGRIGPSRVVWRYDPVILDADFPLDYHKKAFADFCAVLAPLARHCVFSFADSYPRLERKIRQPPRAELEEAAREFAAIAARHGLQLYACAEEGDYAAFGVQRSACIDARIVAELNAGTRSRILPRLNAGKDKNQRKECGCVSSVDIGTYGTCRHGCVYCYACRRGGRRNPDGSGHDPASPMLFGRPGGDEIIVEL
jgi:hypothetical protein